MVTLETLQQILRSIRPLFIYLEVLHLLYLDHLDKSEGQTMLAFSALIPTSESTVEI
jgi:hypothetical protein